MGSILSKLNLYRYIIHRLTFLKHGKLKLSHICQECIQDFSSGAKLVDLWLKDGPMAGFSVGLFAGGGKKHQDNPQGQINIGFRGKLEVIAVYDSHFMNSTGILCRGTSLKVSSSQATSITLN